MSIEYRQVTDADYDELAVLEAVAFYGRPGAEDAGLLRKLVKPEWTVAAFDGGRPVADVRAMPMQRLMAGTRTPFAVVGPVTCLAPYRRQGHVGKLLRMTLERLHERGEPLSGLYTPHDALYRRYGWERAEEKRRLNFDPGDVTFRMKQANGGRTRPAGPDDWERLDAIYQRKTEPLNGALARHETWWRWAVLTDLEGKDKLPREAVVWVNAAGEDRGYAVYQNRPTGNREDGWATQEIWIRDFTALDADAYLGLWSHVLTHDLASNVTFDAPPDDPFVDLLEDPFVVKASRAEGPMIRIVDVEGAIAARPFLGQGAPSFTMRIRDESAPWNDGAWRIEAAEGQMRAQKTDAGPDIEMSVNFLSPLYTGFRSPETLASVGMLTVHRPDALPAVTEAFAVTRPPYTQDFY
jgi:predicted acetyltransferase